MPEDLFAKKYSWIIENGAHLKHPAVAAANVLARYYLIMSNDMDKANGGDFGSGNNNDKKTIEWIKKNPKSDLIRKNWKRYHEILKEIQNGKEKHIRKDE